MTTHYKNTFWLTISQSTTILANFIVGSYVIKYLGAELFGILSFALSLLVILQPIASLGLDGVLLRELVKHPENRDKLLGSSILLKISAGMMSFIILITVGVFLIQDPLAKFCVLIISSSLLFQSFDIINLYFQSRMIMKIPVFVQVLVTICSSIAKILFIQNQISFLFFPFLILLDFLLLAFGYISIYLWYKLRILEWSWDPKLARQLLLFAWPDIIYGGLLHINMRTDQIMLKYYLSNEAVGIYGAASRLVEALYFIPLVIGGALFPVLVKAKEEKNNYLLQFQYIYETVFVLAILLIVFMNIFSCQIIEIIYGASFSYSAPVLRIYAFSLIFIFWGSIRAKWLLIENIQVFNIIFLLSSVITNIILCYFFIHWWGSSGAALATVISYSIAFYFTPLLFAKTRLSIKMFNNAILIGSLRKKLYLILQKKPLW